MCILSSAKRLSVLFFLSTALGSFGCSSASYTFQGRAREKNVELRFRSFGLYLQQMDRKSGLVTQDLLGILKVGDILVKIGKDTSEVSVWEKGNGRTTVLSLPMDPNAGVYRLPMLVIRVVDSLVNQKEGGSTFPELRSLMFQFEQGNQIELSAMDADFNIITGYIRKSEWSEVKGP
jgi:hypothetical protein